MSEETETKAKATIGEVMEGAKNDVENQVVEKLKQTTKEIVNPPWYKTALPYTALGLLLGWGGTSLGTVGVGDHNKIVNDLQQKYTKDIGDLTAKNTAAMTALNTKHATNLSNLRQQYTNTIKVAQIVPYDANRDVVVNDQTDQISFPADLLLNTNSPGAEKELKHGGEVAASGAGPQVGWATNKNNINGRQVIVPDATSMLIDPQIITATAKLRDKIRTDPDYQDQAGKPRINYVVKFKQYAQGAEVQLWKDVGAKNLGTMTFLGVQPI